MVFEPGGKHILLSPLANPSSFNDVLQTDMNAGDFGPRQRDLWVVRCASPFDLARAALA